MKDFLIATLNRTRLNSTRIRAISALAIGCPPNLSKQTYTTGKTIISVMGSMPMLRKSNRKTRVRKREKSGSLWVSFSASNDALANFTGGFPATVIGSPSRDRICRRNWMSLPGVETPSRKLDGKFPYSATQLLPPKKFRGISRRRSLKCSAPQSSMFVKHPLEKKIWESAVATSGTRLNMTSHSEAPNRGKCMPARALRYCPVMLQVHSLWMPLNLFILYIRRAPLSPREGYRPGETAVQRMKRQPSREVTTTVTQLTINE